MLKPWLLEEIVWRLQSLSGCDGVTGLPLRGAVKSRRVYGHYEGAWIPEVLINNRWRYAERVDPLHWLAFPSAECCHHWCQRQQMSGGVTTVHVIPADYKLAPHEAFELHSGPGLSGQERRLATPDDERYALEHQDQLAELTLRLVAASGRLDVLTYDSWHAVNVWDIRGPRLRQIGQYVRDVHLQPYRHEPEAFDALLSGRANPMTNEILLLRDDCGFNGDVTLEVSPFLIKRLLGRKIFHLDSVLELLQRALSQTRHLLGD